jgi:ATP-dependent DNA helicase RecG
MELLLTKYLKAAISYQGIQRIESFPVPREALREAILNALIHRDYANTAPIQIRVYDDRLCIWNPGVLPENWTVRKLFSQHSSCPFNPLVANAFFRAGEIEAWGRGMQRMVDACKNAGTPKPKISYDPSDLWMEFPFSPEYLQILSTPPEPEGSSEKTTQKTTQKILEIIKKEPSAGRLRIAELLGSITEDGVKSQLSKLKRQGFIRRVGPAKGGHWEVLK